MKTKIVLLLLFVLSYHFSFGQVDSSEVNSSPYSAIYNHLFYLQSESYDPGRAALSLPSDIENRVELSRQLKQILDGKGMYVDINRLPRNNSYRDSIAQEAIYFINRSEHLIYLEKQDDNWYYSRTTIEAIPMFYKKVYPFGTQFIRYFQAPTWQLKFLGVKIWKWLGLIALLLISGLLFIVINKISRAFLRKLLRNYLELTEVINKILMRLARIVGLLLAVRFLFYFLPMFQLDAKLNALIIKGLNILSIFFALLIIRLIIQIIFHYIDRIAEKTENTLDDQLLPVLEKLAVIVLWVLGAIYILDYLNVNITALIAGLSIGGLALALAAQDTVKNFFGSIMIFADKPFQIGDAINFDGVGGVVEEVGVRSTRIRTYENSITYVPNAKIADSVVDNLGLRKFRRFKKVIGVTYDTKPHQIDGFVDGIREILMMHPATKKDAIEVHLNDMSDSSIDILVYSFFDVPSWNDELKARHQIFTAIIKLADSLQVSFAFPTQSLHVETAAGVKTKPKEIPDEDEIKKILQERLNITKQEFDAGDSINT